MARNCFCLSATPFTFTHVIAHEWMTALGASVVAARCCARRSIVHGGMRCDVVLDDRIIAALAFRHPANIERAGVDRITRGAPTARQDGSFDSLHHRESRLYSFAFSFSRHGTNHESAAGNDSTTRREQVEATEARKRKATSDSDRNAAPRYRFTS
ncbi:MAG TPA: hypothetical protein VHW00_13100 [Thermoanaerobaculia bacterium]|nr:hypothetical protein [Thermoanaerobaculia bacterium]